MFKYPTYNLLHIPSQLIRSIVCIFVFKVHGTIYYVSTSPSIRPSVVESKTLRVVWRSGNTFSGVSVTTWVNKNLVTTSSYISSTLGLCCYTWSYPFLSQRCLHTWVMSFLNFIYLLTDNECKYFFVLLDHS